MDVVNKTQITCKKAAYKKEKAILKEWAKKTVELLRSAEFLLQEFKLDCQRTPPMIAEVADAIGQKYGRLSMRAKTIFHAKQLKVKITRLKILTSHSCHHINKMESELKYIQGLKKA